MAVQDRSFEQRVSGALRGQRPTDGAPAGLRVRVASIPSAPPSSGRFRGFAPMVLITTALAAAVAVVAIRSGVLAPVTIAPGTSGIGVDPSIEGPEVVTSLMRTLPIVGWGIAVVLAGIAVRTARRAWPRPKSVVAAGIMAAVAVAAAGLAQHPGPSVGGWNGYGPVLGFRQLDTGNTADAAGQPQLRLYTGVEAQQPFAVFFVVSNPGPLPVRLEGIMEDEGAKDRIAPRWTALALAASSNEVGAPLDHAIAFSPVDIPAGGDIGLYLIGKASACAIGAAPLESDQTYAVRGPDIELVYSLFGLTNTSTYHMPLVIEEPIVNGCTG